MKRVNRNTLQFRALIGFLLFIALTVYGISNYSKLILYFKVDSKSVLKNEPNPLETAAFDVRVKSIADSALLHTASTLPTRIPVKPNWTDRGDDIRVDDRYQKEVSRYREHVKKDRSLLVNAFNEIIKKSGDREITRITSDGLKNLNIKGIESFEISKENHELITRDHNNLRNILLEISRIPYQKSVL